VPASPRVAGDIFDCIRLNQRNVDNYQYDNVDLNGSSDAFAADAEHRARVKHLRLCLWDTRNREQAHTVLDSVHGLTSLNVDIREGGFKLHHVALELAFRALSKDYERSWIRSLRLDGIDFGRYGRPLPRLPGAQNLKHLQLVYCHTYGPFLQMLTALSTDLVTLTIEEGDTGSGSFDDDVNDFIRSLSSLERVSLTLDADFEQLQGLLDWSALHKCAPVIKSLKLQYRCVLPPYPSDENVLDFRRFCENASSLEQLSISGIDLPMNKEFGDMDVHGSLEQFLVSLHLSLPLEGAITDMNFQGCVQRASALAVLRLNVWVSCNTIPLSHGASLEAHVRRAQDLAQRREHLIKRTADKILSTLASSCPRLKVVVIEATWEYGLADYAVRAFLKSKQIDLFGHSTVVGMPVEPHMIKHYEPCSDVLEPDKFVFA
jgi:hypothetical protein